jgi:hypothetical protein
LSAKQTIESTTETKVNLNEASIDTDTALTDGKFKPSVAGYYQVSGATRSAEDGIINITAHIYKNSQLYCRGSHIHHSPNDGGSDLSVVSDVVYLNGKEDYIELYVQLKMGSKNIRNGLENTYLSAVLVSGGSASGDSIWKQNGTNVSLKDDSVQFIDKGTFTKQVIFSPDGSQNLKTEVLDNGKNLIASSNAISFETNGENSIEFNPNGKQAMSIDSSGVVKTNAFIQNEVATDQDATHMRFRNPNGAIGKIRSIGNSMYFDGLVTSFAQVEGLESTLSAKDKLIEKLSKRLDSLEKKLKKTK